MYVLFYVVKLNMNIFVGKFCHAYLIFLRACAHMCERHARGDFAPRFQNTHFTPSPPPTIFRIVRIFTIFTQFLQLTPNNSENSDNSITFHNPVYLFMHNYTPYIHRTSVSKHLFQLNFCRGGEI